MQIGRITQLTESTTKIGMTTLEANKIIAAAHAEIVRLRAALTAISDLQDRSFAPTKDLIGVAVILARNALKG